MASGMKNSLRAGTAEPVSIRTLRARTRAWRISNRYGRWNSIGSSQPEKVQNSIRAVVQRPR